MEHIYDAIVIGAGISGIGASFTLSKAHCNHIILESRDRIGGRIFSKQFDGVTIDIGASFVHHPHHGNQIKKIMDELFWKSNPANFQNQQYLYEFIGKLDKKTINKAQILYEELIKNVEQNASLSKKDISLYEAAGNFISHKISKESDLVKNTVNWLFEIHSNVEGAQLKQISAKQFVNDQSEHDLLPVGGYAKLLQAIFDQYSPQVKLNEKVIKIDFTSQVIKVYTEKSTYQAKKVISSLPLGILLNNIVQFVPELAKKHIQCLNKIGNGVANKLFVSFQEPFWSIDKSWLNFVTSQPSKYPVAFNMFTNNQKYMLCVFISANASKCISELTNQQIIKDFIQFLKQFYPTALIKVRDYQITRWHKDPDSLGSYSYFKVGATESDIEQLKTPIDNKIWFIGEHCHPTMNACAHAAFQTGLWAATEVLTVLKGQK